jgi:hypothetical protein
MDFKKNRTNILLSALVVSLSLTCLIMLFKNVSTWKNVFEDDEVLLLEIPYKFGNIVMFHRFNPGWVTYIFVWKSKNRSCYALKV